MPPTRRTAVPVPTNAPLPADTPGRGRRDPELAAQIDAATGRTRRTTPPPAEVPTITLPDGIEVDVDEQAEYAQVGQADPGELELIYPGEKLEYGSTLPFTFPGDRKESYISCKVELHRQPFETVDELQTRAAVLVQQGLLNQVDMHLANTDAYNQLVEAYSNAQPVRQA